MTYTTVYDLAREGVGLQFPLIGLGLILVGAVMKWGFGKSTLYAAPPVVIGVFVMLVSGAVPLWDRSRVLQAVTGGEAKQVEGSVHDWRIVRIRGRRYSTGDRKSTRLNSRH